MGDNNVNQEVFDRVRAHLLAQGKKSLIIEDDGRRSCRYRGPDGLKCAIGCLIHDEAYTPDLEDRHVRRLRVMRALEESGVMCTDLCLLSDLQSVHDGIAPSEWAGALAEVGKRFGLKVAQD